MKLPLEEIKELVLIWKSNNARAIQEKEENVLRIAHMAERLAVSQWHKWIMTIEGYDNRDLAKAQEAFLKDVCEKLSLGYIMDAKGRYCIFRVPRPREPFTRSSYVWQMK